MCCVFVLVCVVCVHWGCVCVGVADDVAVDVRCVCCVFVSVCVVCLSCFALLCLYSGGGLEGP